MAEESAARGEPLVSIVMPVLDPHPEYFSRAVESVIAQSMKDWELIIVEDPSPSRVESYLPANEPRIHHVANAERTSFASQLNQGLALARGSFIARFDADDLCATGRLAKQVDYLNIHSEVDVVGCQLLAIDHRGKQLGYRTYPQNHDDIVRHLKRYSALAHPAVMFRRCVLRRAGEYAPGQFPGTEDYDLWCRWATRGVRFANHPEALVQYRIHPQAMKAARLRTLLKGTLEIKRTHWRGQLTAAEHARMFAEQLLLWLPPSLVLWMFTNTHYSRTLSCRTES